MMETEISQEEYDRQVAFTDDLAREMAANKRAMRSGAYLELLAERDEAKRVEHQTFTDAAKINVENNRLLSVQKQLVEALEPFAAFADVYIPHADAGYGNHPREGSLYVLSTKAGSAEITVEAIRNASAAILAAKASS